MADIDSGHADIVILGTGQAGLQAAVSLREEGFAGSIALVGDEMTLPYQRPPLSKAFLTGAMTEDGLVLRSKGLLDKLEIRFVPGTRADAIERAERKVILGEGRRLGYGHLIIATGSRSRRLAITGADLAGVVYLRNIEDARQLRGQMETANAVTVLGAGFIGLEFAAVAAKLGKAVTVIEAAQRPMARAVSPDCSEFFRLRHEAWGVDFRFGQSLAAIEGKGGQIAAIRLDDGTQIATDLLLIGIGGIANAELAGAAGLPVSNGIVVDDHLLTGDPAISAIGDCASHPNPFAGGMIRLESVQNAIDQGRLVAARLAGKPQPYRSVPWFWSDQGDLKLQMAGLTSGCDEIVMRGDQEAGKFSLFCFRESELVGIESVNRPADNMMARRILAAACPWSRSALEDVDFDLKMLAAGPWPSA